MADYQTIALKIAEETGNVEQIGVMMTGLKARVLPYAAYHGLARRERSREQEMLRPRGMLRPKCGLPGHRLSEGVRVVLRRELLQRGSAHQPQQPQHAVLAQHADSRPFDARKPAGGPRRRGAARARQGGRQAEAGGVGWPLRLLAPLCPGPGREAAGAGLAAPEAGEGPRPAASRAASPAAAPGRRARRRRRRRGTRVCSPPGGPRSRFRPSPPPPHPHHARPSPHRTPGAQFICPARNSAARPPVAMRAAVVATLSPLGSSASSPRHRPEIACHRRPFALGDGAVV
ncbi:Protein of unknown function, partial [Gryllus bimaculatus]